MRRHRPICVNSLPGVAPPLGAERAEVAVPPAGQDRREFICRAMLAGSVIALGWPAFDGAAWSDGTVWSDGRGWSS
jgi:hypothetical protein